MDGGLWVESACLRTVNYGISRRDLLAVRFTPSFPEFIHQSENQNFTSTTKEVEDNQNPIDADRVGCNETLLVDNIPCQIDDDESITIALFCEGRQPKNILSDEFCEELAYPYLFANGKFGYKVQLDVALSPSKYFNQRLLNYKQNFAKDVDYIFFALSVIQQINLQNSMNFALKKVTSNTLTAGDLSADYRRATKALAAMNKGYS